MRRLRILLLPFSFLYGLVIWLRNRCYDWGWLKSTAFEQPVIVVGNLAVGGTGKSPMTEYLVRLLEQPYRVATLSRGYGRKTRGFREVNLGDTADLCGDEPLQFKHKFPQITVAVDEKRVNGVSRLLQTGHEVILLDDAYQHRALRPGLALLLFDYPRIQGPRWLLPAGDYRDAFRERKRANLMVVTKTPTTLAVSEKVRIQKMLSPSGRIPVLFSSIGYGQFTPMFARGGHEQGLPGLDGTQSVVLLTGIANPTPLVEHLQSQAQEVVHLRYADHHPYTKVDIERLVGRFHQLANSDKLIVTTEKDAQRLLIPELSSLLNDLPVYMMPIHITFDPDDERILRETVLDYCCK